MSDETLSPEDFFTPEELIVQMGADELQELLTDMGFEATESMASSIQNLVKQLGSLEAAIALLSDDDSSMSRAA